MNHELADDPNDRLVDVLLEEALRQQAATGVVVVPQQTATRTWRTRWFALVAALLGVCAVVATSLLPPNATGGSPTQDPSPPSPEPKPRANASDGIPWEDGKQIVPTTEAELRALAPQFHRLRVRLLNLLDFGGRRTPTLVPFAEATLESREAVQRFVARLPLASASLEGLPRSYFGDAWIAFELADGRHVDAFFFSPSDPLQPADAKAMSLFFGAFQMADVELETRATLGELVRTANATAEERVRLARRIVENLDDLAQIPAEARILRCPPPTSGTVRGRFARFAQLRHLEFTTTLGLDGGTRSILLPGDTKTVLRELVELRDLQHLRLPGYMLGDDAHAADLVALPALSSLRLDGPFQRPLQERTGDGSQAAAPGLTATGLRALAAKLTALEIVDGNVTADDLEPFVAAGKLKVLRLFGDPLPASTLARLARMPSLTALSLGGTVWTDEHLRALADSKITALRLEYTDATTEGVQQLPRSLRLLDLQRQGFMPKQREALTGRWPASIAVGPGFAPEPADSPFADPFAGFGTTRR